MNAADEPNATSVSMLGALWISPLKPLIKNFWLIIITAAVKRSCISPIATWFPSSAAGSGKPNIICPIEKYIRTIKNTSDQISLRFRTGVSLSASASSPLSACALLPAAFFLSDAP